MYIYETADEIEYELLKANAIKNRQHSTEAEKPTLVIPKRKTKWSQVS